MSNTMKSPAMREQMRVGHEIKRALDAIVPESCRMTDAQIGQHLGISRQMVGRIELQALYKIRMKLKEIMAQENRLR